MRRRLYHDSVCLGLDEGCYPTLFYIIFAALSHVGGVVRESGYEEIVTLLTKTCEPLQLRVHF